MLEKNDAGKNYLTTTCPNGSAVERQATKSPSNRNPQVARHTPTPAHLVDALVLHLDHSINNSHPPIIIVTLNLPRGIRDLPDRDPQRTMRTRWTNHLHSRGQTMPGLFHLICHHLNTITTTCRTSVVHPITINITITAMRGTQTAATYSQKTGQVQEWDQHLTNGTEIGTGVVVRKEKCTIAITIFVTNGLPKGITPVEKEEPPRGWMQSPSASWPVHSTRDTNAGANISNASSAAAGTGPWPPPPSGRFGPGSQLHQLGRGSDPPAYSRETGSGGWYERSASANAAGHHYPNFVPPDGQRGSRGPPPYDHAPPPSNAFAEGSRATLPEYREKERIPPWGETSRVERSPAEAPDGRFVHRPGPRDGGMGRNDDAGLSHSRRRTLSGVDGRGPPSDKLGSDERRLESDLSRTEVQPNQYLDHRPHDQRRHPPQSSGEEGRGVAWDGDGPKTLGPVSATRAAIAQRRRLSSEWTKPVDAKEVVNDRLRRLSQFLSPAMAGPDMARRMKEAVEASTERVEDHKADESEPAPAPPLDMLMGSRVTRDGTVRVGKVLSTLSERRIRRKLTSGGGAEHLKGE
ncbi:hypothetical protein HK102_003896 [Quaeritorhiza haematococci]|nr:hypothetical protein HK102_003896 [Quaeritorhiza haematococci]